MRVSVRAGERVGKPYACTAGDDGLREGAGAEIVGDEFSSSAFAIE